MAAGFSRPADERFADDGPKPGTRPVPPLRFYSIWGYGRIVLGGRIMSDEENANATVYLETTIVSYLTSYPSSLIIVAANQELTRQWWREERQKYRCFVSSYVTDECVLGDADAARRALKF